MAEATRLTFELIWASSKDRDAKGAVQVTEDVLQRIGVEAGLSEAEAAAMVEELGSDENKAVLKDTCVFHHNRLRFRFLRPFLISGGKNPSLLNLID